MNGREILERRRGQQDSRDAEIARLKREVEALRERERSARAEAENARKHFSELTVMSKRFARSMQGGVRDRQQYRRRLGAQYAVSRVLAEVRDLDEAAPRIFEVLGERLGWDLGVLWTLDRQAGVLRRAGIWRSSEISSGAMEEACEDMSLRRGESLPGRVWEREKPVWVEDVLEDEYFLRDVAAAEDGLRGAFAFPIRDGSFVGVFEFFRRNSLSPDEDLLWTAGFIGEQIGQFLERRRAEEERERLAREVAIERARFEAILQQMPAGVFITTPSGEFVLSNEEATRIYGRPVGSVEECVRHASSYPDGEEIPPERYPLKRSLAGEVVSDDEHYVRRPDGTTVVVNTSSAPVRDREGRIVAAVKTLEDVTWRKEAEEALRESEERLRTVVNNAPVVLFALDREGVFTLSTGRSLEALELEPNEAVGRSIFEVYAGNPAVLEDVRRALDGEAHTGIEEVNGLIFETGYAPIRDRSGEVTGVIGVATDITERKEAEEERERSLAHEWRARAEAEERKRIGRELHDRVAHAMGVVHQSLELYEVFKERAPSQAEEKMKLARETTREALDLTRNISRELHSTEAKDGLSAALSNLLKTTVPPGLESNISVEGDETLVPPRVREQLFLILREAVRNAVSHSEAGQLGIVVKVDPQRVVGCVEDDGRGLEGTSEGDNGGAGRGLQSMKERAGLVGGDLRLFSAPGAGTRIEASVPLLQMYQ